MGANTSALLSEEIEEISRDENLTEAQVKRLYNRFQKLDPKQSGTLDASALMMIPELAMNPLHPRLVDMFENANFRQFVSLVSAFSGRANADTKADFAFRIYDVDNDGYISFNDLKVIFRMLVGDHIPSETMDSIIEKVVNDADADHDGRISRNDFSGALDVSAIAANLTVAL